MIPITKVEFGHEEEELVLSTLRSGSIAQGPMVAELEERFTRLTGAAHAVAVNNGTTALIAALATQDLVPGDEVVTTPFTFVATINAALDAGATVRFADVDESDFTLDPASVAGAVTERTRVILPVHLFGQTADMAPLLAQATQLGATVLEDAAQAHGARYRGRGAGSFGLGTFSLYATKNITTGEGGVITTNDDRLADRLRVLRNQGMRERYVYEFPGSNFRLTDLQAALALPQLDRYEAVIAARRRNAAVLTEGLAGVPGLVVPTEREDRRHVWHQFTVRVTGDAKLDRDALSADLRRRGIGSGIYYPRLIDEYDAYREHPRVLNADTPIARRVARQVLSLPVHQHLSSSDLERIVASVRDALGAP